MVSRPRTRDGLDETPAKENSEEEEMTKEPKSGHGKSPEKPQHRPEERPRPAQDGWSRKDSDNTKTTDWNKPPRPPKGKDE